jgi:hypothetical protein
VETKVKAIGMMTTPRYVANWPQNLIRSAFNTCKITLMNSGGVYYGQCMQNMLESAVKEGVEIAITVDSDSLFSPKQLKTIIENCVNDPAIDALAALQCRRGMPHPLLSVEMSGSEPIEIKFEGKPLQVKTAHFGLTVIKLDRLRDVPKPWFWAQPDENGGWGDGRIDDDIWFWKQWEKAGRSVYIDSSVNIGHFEELASCFDENGEHQVRYPQDWKAEVIG